MHHFRAYVFSDRKEELIKILVAAQYCVAKTTQTVCLTRFLDALLVYSRWAVSTADFTSGCFKNLRCFSLIVKTKDPIMSDVIWANLCQRAYHIEPFYQKQMHALLLPLPLQLRLYDCWWSSWLSSLSTRRTRFWYKVLVRDRCLQRPVRFDAIHSIGVVG